MASEDLKRAAYWSILQEKLNLSLLKDIQHVTLSIPVLVERNLTSMYGAVGYPKLPWMNLTGLAKPGYSYSL